MAQNILFGVNGGGTVISVHIVFYEASAVFLLLCVYFDLYYFQRIFCRFFANKKFHSVNIRSVRHAIEIEFAAENSTNIFNVKYIGSVCMYNCNVHDSMKFTCHVHSCLCGFHEFWKYDRIWRSTPFGSQGINVSDTHTSLPCQSSKKGNYNLEKKHSERQEIEKNREQSSVHIPAKSR